jgi:hypothetical protein
MRPSDLPVKKKKNLSKANVNYALNEIHALHLLSDDCLKRERKHIKQQK